MGDPVRRRGGITPPSGVGRRVTPGDFRERIDPSMFRFPGLVKKQLVTVVRPEDLLVLAFEFRGLTREVEGTGENRKAALHRTGSAPAFIIVHLQPQNVAEEAFFESAPNFTLKRPPPDDGKEYRPDPDESADIDQSPPSEGALPAETLLAGPSRLVFKVPADAEPIEYTLAGILDACRRFELNVPLTALPPADPPPRLFLPPWLNELERFVAGGASAGVSAAALARAKARLHRWQDESDLVPVTVLGAENLIGVGLAVPEATPGGGTGPTAGAVFVGGPRTLAERIPDRTIAAIVDLIRRKPRLQPPTETETALELPFRLLISPNRHAAWVHALLPVRSETTGRAELWHTRLATRVETPNGKIVEENDHRLRTVRAVWARSGMEENPPEEQRFTDDPNDRPIHVNEPFRMSLDAADRFDIVHESSNFNINSNGPSYVPVPIDVDRLMLTSLGAWIDSRGRWEPPTPQFEVEEWRHRGTIGRDHYVRVVYKGYLWPFGHRASVIKVTERKLHPPASPALPGNPAILRQRMYIVVRQPVLTYGDPELKSTDGSRFYDHQLPLTSVRITTLVTADLDPPEDSDYPKTWGGEDPFASPNGLKQSLFWPKVGKNFFRFHVVAEDLEANRLEFTAPLLFVSNVHATDAALLGKVKDHYEKEVVSEVGTIGLGGQRMAMAPSAVPEPSPTPVDNAGATSFEVENVELGVEIPEGATFTRLGPDRPRFYPRFRRARIVVPVIKGFTGNGKATVVEFAQEFLQHGLPAKALDPAHPNKGQIFLKIAEEAPALDFTSGSQKAGGFVQPNIDLSGVSRMMGPVGGALGPLSTGTFTPSQFFDALKARLFGVVDLGEVIQGLGLDNPDLVPKFITETFSAVETFTKDLDRLQAETQQLKNAASTAAASVKNQINGLQANVQADVAEITTALDGLLDGTDTSVALTSALGDLSTHLGQARDLLEGLGPPIPADTRKALQSTVGGFLTDLAAVAQFATALVQALQLPEELTLRFEWKPELQHWPDKASESGSIFVAKNGTNESALTIAAEIQAKTKLRPEPAFDVACRLHNFTLNLIGPASFMLLRFNKLEFTARSGSKPDVNVEFDDIEFTGALSFVEALRTLIPLDGFSDPPALTVSEKGVAASFSMALPDLAFGVFSLQNLSLGAGFTVPFLLDPLSVRFQFCERESPFLLTVSMFGGGGFFGITLDPDGVEILEASFEFGASLAVNLGVASGGVTVMAGIYFKMQNDEAALTGYFRMGGEVDVLGLISACIELYLGLAYEFASGKAVGTATITVEVEVAFFSASVSISCERKFAGSDGDPTFAELMGPGADIEEDPWVEYSEAFA